MAWIVSILRQVVFPLVGLAGSFVAVVLRALVFLVAQPLGLPALEAYLGEEDVRGANLGERLCERERGAEPVGEPVETGPEGGDPQHFEGWLQLISLLQDLDRGRDRWRPDYGPSAPEREPEG